MDKDIFENGMDGARVKKGISFFDENMLNPKATTDAPNFIEFDWEVLRRNLREAKEELGGADYERLAEVLSELLRWIVKGDKLPIIGRRAVALAWVVNPKLFEVELTDRQYAKMKIGPKSKEKFVTADGRITICGPSAAALARKIGCHKAMLSQDSAEASRRFKVSNRSQAHGKGAKPGKPAPSKKPAGKPGKRGRCVGVRRSSRG
ncbi:MAG: hypothetical protein JWR19_2187 [Pedosphaera sp.]|nr:hypothetical protein [Pedosphaera sp.]